MIVYNGLMIDATAWEGPSEVYKSVEFLELNPPCFQILDNKGRFN